MKITPDFLFRARTFINPCGEREIDLRGHGISFIRNLGVLNDQFGSLDISDNRIEKLENLPKFPHLNWILASNNLICSIQEGLETRIPNLHVLVLSNNLISMLSELDKLQGLGKLFLLNLDGCPVQKCENYRLYAIFKLPHLKILDNDKVRDKERATAKAMFGSQKGQKFVQSVADQAKLMAQEHSTAAVSGAQLTTAQKESLRKALLDAKTQAEVDKIEKILKSGVVPKEMDDQRSTPMAESNERTKKSKMNQSPGTPNGLRKSRRNSIQSPAQGSSETEGSKRLLREISSSHTSDGGDLAADKPGSRTKSRKLDPTSTNIEHSSKRTKKATEPANYDETERVSKLKVVELKKELASLGINPVGKKSELQKQLLDALKSKKA